MQNLKPIYWIWIPRVNISMQILIILDKGANNVNQSRSKIIQLISWFFIQFGYGASFKSTYRIDLIRVRVFNCVHNTTNFSPK